MECAVGSLSGSKTPSERKQDLWAEARPNSTLHRPSVLLGSKSNLHLLHSVKGLLERWGAGVETQKNVRGEIGGWGRVPFNEPDAPSLSTIYDGA